MLMPKLIYFNKFIYQNILLGLGETSIQLMRHATCRDGLNSICYLSSDGDRSGSVCRSQSPSLHRGKQKIIKARKLECIRLIFGMWISE